MVERRKIRTEKGLALVPGANKLSGGCNFAVEVPERQPGISGSLQKEIKKTFCGDFFYARRKNREYVCVIHPGFSARGI